MANWLSAKIEKIEGNFVVLRTDDNQEISWSRDNLPSGAEKGTKVRLELKSESEAAQSQKAQAKEILNEILKGE